MKKTIALILTVIAYGAVSCVNPSRLSGKRITAEYDINPTYTSLEIKSPINVRYTGDADRIIIEADSLIMPFVVVESDNGNVEIYLNQAQSNIGKITATIPASAAISSISVSSASSFKADSVINVPSLDISVSGASRFTAAVNCEKIDAEIKDASSVDMAGYVDDLKLEVEGASRLAPGKDGLTARNAFVNISGASRTDITCLEKLSGEITGASSLKYSGDCKCDVEVSGASHISK